MSVLLMRKIGFQENPKMVDAMSDRPYNMHQYGQENLQLPISTGCTLLSKKENASRTERPDIASATSSLLVKSREILSPKAKNSAQNNSPITEELETMTLTENIAALAFPLPSSLDTRTL